MHPLSTSIVSLHKCAEIHDDAKQSKRSLESKPSILYFLGIFYSFLCMGFGSALIGPTLLKFSEQINVPLHQIIYIFTIRSLGFLFGTLIGGVLIDHFYLYGDGFLALSILTMSASIVTIPFMYTFIPLIVVHVSWSVAAGIVDNLAQILTIRHYKQMNVNPYLQALHGAFGIGACSAPLIIAPFLQNSRPVDQWHYAYWLIGLFHVPDFIWIFVYAILNLFCKREEITVEMKEFVVEKNDIRTETLTDNKVDSVDKFLSKDILFVGLMTMFILLYVGTETAFGSYIHTYAILHLNFEKDIAAYLNSVFWASFALGRMCGIPLSFKLSPLKMILTDLIGCIFSLTLIFVFNKLVIVLWIGCALFGLSVASIYASAIAYTEKHVQVNGKRMSMMAIGGSAGDALIPFIVGYSIDLKQIGSVGFIVITGVSTVIASLLFMFIVLYVKYKFNRKQNTEK